MEVLAQRNEVRRKLLAEYAVALVAERASWERLREPQLDDAERCRVLAEWKETAARLKTLARAVRDAAPANPTTPASTTSQPIQRPFHVPWLVASSWLVAMLRPR